MWYFVEDAVPPLLRRLLLGSAGSAQILGTHSNYIRLDDSFEVADVYKYISVAPFTD